MKFNEYALAQIILCQEAGLLPDTLHEIFESRADLDTFAEELSDSPWRLITDRAIVALTPLIDSVLEHGCQSGSGFSNSTVANAFLEIWDEEESDEDE